MRCDMTRWAATISVALLSLQLGACTTKGLQSPLPDGEMTIFERFQSAFAPPAPDNIPVRLPDGDGGLHGYTRDAANELNIRFPRLPNPTLVMYVFPHLSAEGTPVPGYSTVFQLYDRAHYALPGE